MKKWKKALYGISAIILVPTVCIIGIAVAAAATGNRFTPAAAGDGENQSVQTESSGPTDGPMEESSATDISAAEKETVVESQTESGTTQAEHSAAGNNAFYLITPSGSSENGNTPILSITADTQDMQIDFSSQGMNDGNLIYIYIDDTLISTGDPSEPQGTLNLSTDMLTEGIHNVNAVQYTDDTINSDILMQVQNRYEVVIQQ